MNNKDILTKVKNIENSLLALEKMLNKKLDEQKREYNNLYFVESVKGLYLLTVQGFKLLFLVSSGATAALLVFLGHLINENKTVLADALKPALVSFLFASLCVSASCFFACGAQMYYSEDPYGDTLYPKGHFMKIICVTLVAISIFLCFYGAIIIYNVSIK